MQSLQMPATPLFLKRIILWLLQHQLYVYVVKKKNPCIKFNCSLKELELSRGADRNSSSVRQRVL